MSQRIWRRKSSYQENYENGSCLSFSRGADGPIYIYLYIDTSGLAHSASEDPGVVVFGSK